MRSCWTMGLKLKLIQAALVFLDIRLAAAGGRASFSQVVKYCATFRNDLAFLYGNKAANALPIYRAPRVHLDQDLYDPRFKALVLAAPVGAPFKDLDRVKLPIFLVRAGAEKTLRASY